MDFQRLYAPKPNQPIFDTRPLAGVILVAAYATVGGSWNPTYCAAGRLAEPWLPGNMPIFNPKESTIQQVPILEGDQIHTATHVHEGRDVAGNAIRKSEHTIAAVLRRHHRKDADGIRMYLLAEDIDCVGLDLLDHVDTRRHATDLSHAQFIGRTMAYMQRIGEVLTEVRRSVNVRFVSFMP